MPIQIRRPNLVTALAIVLSAFGLGEQQCRATDLIISLPGDKPIARKTVSYRCDSNGVKLGLPAADVDIEYINGNGNSLATLPIFGSRVIFANVSSGSGARYASQQYIWWEAGGSATLYLDSISGKQSSVCKPIAKR